MGCCASTSRDANLPAHASSRDSTAPSTRRPSHASHPQPPDDRPNAPLRPILSGRRSQLPNAAGASSSSAARPKPLSAPVNAPWTPSRLAKERQDWWDTRVTGNPETWGAIRLASQYLQDGEVQEAQTMLDVAGCTCPTGLLWRGVYDATGVQYTVPEWVIVAPDGLVEEEQDVVGETLGGARQRVEKDAGGGGGSSFGDGDEQDDEVVTIKVRLSHGQHDVVVRVESKATTEKIAAAVLQQAELDPRTTTLRLVYAGRLYQPLDSLDAHPHWHFANHHVLTAFVTQL